jgi:hypothetical protein
MGRPAGGRGEPVVPGEVTGLFPRGNLRRNHTDSLLFRPPLWCDPRQGLPRGFPWDGRRPGWMKLPPGGDRARGVARADDDRLPEAPAPWAVTACQARWDREESIGLPSLDRGMVRKIGPGDDPPQDLHRVDGVPVSQPPKERGAGERRALELAGVTPFAGAAHHSSEKRKPSEEPPPKR